MSLLFFTSLTAYTDYVFLIWNFYIENKILTLAVIGILLLVFSLLFRFIRRKKKRKEGEEEAYVPPVTDIIGTERERLEQLNKDLKPFGFAYDPSNDLFYSLMDCWQRKFGYCRLYDEASALFSMIIDCEPIYFRYRDKKWLLEFWKGQYGMTTGAEVGIYYTSKPDLDIPGIFKGTFYHCVKDEDRINMSFILRKNGNILFTRTGYHWWLTGFKLGEFSQPSELAMDIILDLHDREMTEAFVRGLKEAGYSESEYGVRGRRVYVHFDKPHTPQPSTRNALTVSIMQRNNRSFCEAYQYLTQAYTNTLDKLSYVKQQSPQMYNQIMNMGKPHQVFEGYNRIQRFLSKQELEEEG